MNEKRGKKMIHLRLLTALFLVTIAACTGSDEGKKPPQVDPATLKPYPVSQLPGGLKWETNNNDPIFKSP